MSQKIDYIYYIALFALFEIINMLFLESSMNLLLTIPQIIVIFYFIISGNLDRAIIWHLVFVLTAVDLNTIDDDIEMLSYPAIKLIGPLTISYILLGIIWISTLRRKISLPQYSLLYRLRKYLIILLVTSSILGLLGVAIIGYHVKDFIPPFRYMLIAVLLTDIFARLYNDSLLEKCYSFAICLLIASPIVSAFSFFILHISYSYSVFESFETNSIFILTPSLFIFLMFKLDKKLNYLALFSLFCLLILTAIAARGSQYITLAVAFLIMIYLVYINKNHNNLVGINFFRFFIPFLGIGAFVSGSILLLSVGDSLAANKLNQFVSLFSILGGGGFSIEEVSTSPYIRIAEILNIIDNGIQNPIGLIIGQGYGAFYTDSLRLFDMLDLSQGAFNDDAISSGKFTTAHSMYPNALLYHGIIGFYFIMKLGILYLKKIPFTPLLFASFVLLLYSLYYNVPLMNACIMFMFASEYKIQYNKELV